MGSCSRIESTRFEPTASRRPILAQNFPQILNHIGLSLISKPCSSQLSLSLHHSFQENGEILTVFGVAEDLAFLGSNGNLPRHLVGMHIYLPLFDEANELHDVNPDVF